MAHAIIEDHRGTEDIQQESREDLIDEVVLKVKCK